MIDDDFDSEQINGMFREYSEGFDPDNFFGYELYPVPEDDKNLDLSDSDDSILFRDLLAQKKTIAALNLVIENKVCFVPNNYVSSIEELVKFAAEDLTALGNYNNAFVVMERYISDVDLVKPFAKNYITSLLTSFREMCSEPEKYDLDFVDDLKNDIFYLEKKYFPQGLFFKSDGKDVSVVSLFNSIRVCSFFESYFENMSFLDKKINEHIAGEEYEKVPPLLKLKEKEYSDYSGFSFIRYAPFK